MDIRHEFVGYCIGCGEVNDINVCPSVATGNGDDKDDYAVDDDGRSLSEFGQKTEVGFARRKPPPQLEGAVFRPPIALNSQKTKPLLSLLEIVVAGHTQASAVVPPRDHSTVETQQIALDLLCRTSPF
ncbi:hypothetical protein L6452_01081 [Arctium lappa]|uniref:Uncharacterized protein n=1 Tax=Arctium lappa TaxID=4217 RepID=A0ACB9FF99_ARCLA|nr:hypothetical protein L6452_01081 [Arctium lappa]